MECSGREASCREAGSPEGCNGVLSGGEGSGVKVGAERHPAWEKRINTDDGVRTRRGTVPAPSVVPGEDVGCGEREAGSRLHLKPSFVV